MITKIESVKLYHKTIAIKIKKILLKAVAINLPLSPLELYHIIFYKVNSPGRKAKAVLTTFKSSYY